MAIRPVTGLECDKSEVSGQRLWGLLEDLCGTPDNFFRNCFIYNYCPLAFFGKNGRNITPPEIKVSTGRLEIIQEQLFQDW